MSKECRLNLHVSPETNEKFRNLVEITGLSLGVVFTELVEVGGSILLEQRIAKLKAAMAAKREHGADSPISASTTPTKIQAIN